MTALQVLAILKREGVPLSRLEADFHRYPQAMVNIGVSRKRPLEELPELQAAVEQVETQLAGRGRVLIRYSGTELKARVMVEGENEDEVNEHAQRLARVLSAALAA